MTDLAHQTAEALVDLIPPAIAPDFLEDYGLTPTAQQAQDITKTVLALTTYWIDCAIRVSIPAPTCDDMHRVIRERIRARWGAKFGLVHVPIDPCLAMMEHRHHTWARLTQQGMEPIAILSEAAGHLETHHVIASHDEQKLLAVLLDLVPIEAIGEHVAELEQHLRPIR